MTWRAEKPDSAGWWWWETREGDQYARVYFQEDCRMPVRIYVHPGNKALCVSLYGNTDDDPAVAELGGRWAGPICEPQEPREQD
jgi:hypothetical protein